MKPARLLIVLIAITAPPAVNAYADDVVTGNNAFAIELYEGLRGDPGNVFCSPFSVSVALAMTYAGARGLTAAEMSATLRFPFDGTQLHRAFHDLQEQVANGPEESELAIAKEAGGN